VGKDKINARKADNLLKFHPNHPITGAFVKIAALKDGREKFLSQIESVKINFGLRSVMFSNEAAYVN